MTRDYKQKAYGESLKNAQKGDLHPVLTCARLTRSCNINCDYCSKIYIKTQPDLEFNDWKNIVDIVYNLENRDFVITGGEPLTKNYALDIISYAASKDSFVTLATNGLLLRPSKTIKMDPKSTEVNLDELNSAGLDFLCISVDYIRGMGKFNFGKRLTKNIISIVEDIGKNKYCFETQISTVVTKYNLNEIPEMVNYFSSLGIATKLMIMMTNNINEKVTEKMSLKNEQKNIQKLSDKLLKMKEKGALLLDDDFTLDRLTQFFKGTFNYNCKGGHFDLSINNDGRLVICPNGEISETTIFSLNGKEEYKRFIGNNKKLTDTCPGCLWSHKQRLEDVISKHNGGK